MLADGQGVDQSGERGRARYFRALTICSGCISLPKIEKRISEFFSRGQAMTVETRPFKTELKQLLQIIIHSLYSHKDIFLRELISNASDAIDTVRFQSLTNGDLLEGDSDWKIKLIPDKEKGTLTISDNGIGMSPETIVEHLGTIAKSGTQAFMQSLKQADVKDRPNLIGQFGVGFYSAFMVADKVTVESRTAGPKANGVRWFSTGEGDYQVETIEKDKRGTDVILHLREADKEYLDDWRLKSLIKKYSDFVEHPIVIDVEKEEEEGKKTVTEETLNSRKALWLRPKSEITQDEYVEFYQHLAHDHAKPAKIIHYSAEGAIEFKALLYIPEHKPFDLMWGESRKGLQLYIQRVFILDDCETLLPLYLRFVRGVVDSPDLPLNVSREILQKSAPLEKIKSNLVNKILSTLDEMKRKEYDEYLKFYLEMGDILKEGVYHDWSNKEKLADLLLYQSTKTEADKYTSLAEYVEKMPADQTEIYYLIGESREMLEQSPYLESFKSKGQEVLLLTEPIDEFVAQSLTTYKDKKLKAVDKGDLPGSVDEEKKKTFASFLEFVAKKLPEVKEVRLSSRLEQSAVCLVAKEGSSTAHMERLMARMGRNKDLPPPERILELNPNHPTVMTIRMLFDRNAEDPRLEDYCRLLYDQAVIAEGSKVRDPLAFAKRINDLLATDAGK
jgi:molecular chaperone HtpG